MLPIRVILIELAAIGIILFTLPYIIGALLLLGAGLIWLISIGIGLALLVGGFFVLLPILPYILAIVATILVLVLIFNIISFGVKGIFSFKIVKRFFDFLKNILLNLLNYILNKNRLFKEFLIKMIYTFIIFCEGIFYKFRIYFELVFSILLTLPFILISWLVNNPLGLMHMILQGIIITITILTCVYLKRKYPSGKYYLSYFFTFMRDHPYYSITIIFGVINLILHFISENDFSIYNLIFKIFNPIWSLINAIWNPYWIYFLKPILNFFGNFL